MFKSLHWSLVGICATSYCEIPIGQAWHMDWKFGLPFVDIALLQRLGPAIASNCPPSKRDLASCAPTLPRAILDRAKTGFTTPVRTWIGGAAREDRREAYAAGQAKCIACFETPAQ